LRLRGRASGCARWRTDAIPTSLDLGELARILTTDETSANRHLQVEGDPDGTRVTA
jgi:hypothetical protein